MSLIVFIKYAWVVPIKGKKDITIVNVFQNILTLQKENQIKYVLVKVGNFSILTLKKF